MSRYIAGGVVVVAVAGVLAAVPYGVGIHARQVVERDIAQLLASQYGQVAVEVRDYRLGWLESRATLGVEVPVAGREPIRFEVEQTVTHGPGLTGLDLYRVAWRPRPPQGAEAKWRATFPGGAPLTAGYRQHLDGSGTLDIDAPAVTTREGGLSIDWSGMQGRFAVAADRHLVGAAGPAALSVGTGKAEVRVEGIGLELDVRSRYESQATLRIARVVVAEPGAQPFVAEAVTVAGGNALAGERLNQRVTLEVAGMGLPDLPRFGPVSLVYGLEGIPVAWLEGLTERMRAATVGKEPAEAQQAVVEVYLEGVPELLAAQPVLRVERLRVEAPQGRMDANLSVTFKSDGPVDLEQGAALLRHVEAAAEVRAGAALLRAVVLAGRARLRGADSGPPPELAVALAERQVDALVLSGAAVRDGDDLKAEVRLAAGQVWLNGNRVYDLNPLVGPTRQEVTVDEGSGAPVEWAEGIPVDGLEGVLEADEAQAAGGGT